MSSRVQVSLSVAHFPERVFLLRHGEWWQALLASLRAEVQAAAPPG